MFTFKRNPISYKFDIEAVFMISEEGNGREGIYSSYNANFGHKLIISVTPGPYR